MLTVLTLGKQSNDKKKLAHDNTINERLLMNKKKMKEKKKLAKD